MNRSAFDFAYLRVHAELVEQFQTERTVRLLGQASSRRVHLDRACDRETVAEPHRDQQARSLRVRPPWKLIQNPITSHLLRPIPVFLPRAYGRKCSAELSKQNRPSRIDALVRNGAVRHRPEILDVSDRLIS